jgi:hypothetical protein
MCSLCLLPVLAISLASCSGGGSDSEEPDVGEVHVALTDAAPDGIDRFEVGVVAIDLLKADGSSVHALPQTARVDFAALTDLTELVNVGSIPSGSYVKTEMTLDFSGASVHIAGNDSDAAVLDESGAALQGQVTVGVTFDGNRPLVVAPGLARILTIDFDLDASTAVDAAANTVAVGAVLIADVDLERQRLHRVRGLLTGVGDNFFRLDLRPFRLKESKFGSILVYVAEETHFEIDGMPSDGAAGFERLKLLAADTAVVVEGAYREADRIFIARSVLAGSSAPGGDLDVVVGHVTARSGNVLTIAGADLDRAGATVTVHTTVSVRLDAATTRITREMRGDALSINAVSVGQKIMALGTLGGSGTAAVLDPARSVRLLSTPITGEVTSVSAGRLVLDVARFGPVPASAFNFAGTGIQAADPASYVVNTLSLDLSGIAAGDPIRVYGVVRPFGSAPPDFEAEAVEEVTDATATLRVVWRPSSTSQFKAVGTAQLQLDLADTAAHTVVQAGIRTVDLTGYSSVTVVPDGAGFYAIRDGGSVTVHAAFADFSQDLQARLAGGTVIARKITAIGGFDGVSGQLTAGTVTVMVKAK